MAAQADDRTCTKCNTIKPVSEFYMNCYGRNGACNDCVKEKNRLYYERKKVDILARKAQREAAAAVAAAMAGAVAMFAVEVPAEAAAEVHAAIEAAAEAAAEVPAAAAAEVHAAIEAGAEAAAEVPAAAGAEVPAAAGAEVPAAAGAEVPAAAAGPLEQRRATPFGDRYAARRANVNANKRDRHANNPQFRAVELYSRRFQRAFAGDKNLQALAGCSLEWFRSWIEHQWQPGMTWENYGTHWCFDHVTPKAAFDFLDEAQARACNDWRNFQPLTRVENSHKRAARDAALEAAQAAKAHAFELANRNQNQVNHNGPRGNNARD